MKNQIAPLLGILLLSAASSSFAAITTVAEYRLGEAGSLGANNTPLDSALGGTPSGAQDINSEISGFFATTGISGVFAPGSNTYLDTSGATNTGWFGSSFASLATDNFAFGVFARATSLAAGNQGDVFSLGGSSGSFKLSLDGNGWAASAHNVSWIGNANGVVNSFSPNTWVHLALVRQSGTTTFYINGVANGTYTGAPTHAAPHLSVSPGGGNYFDGLIDEARVVTFDAADTAADILNALTGGPVLIPDKLVQTTLTSYDQVSLASGTTSEYRPATDVTTINKPDLFSVANGHTLKVISSPSTVIGIYDLIKYNSTTPVSLANFNLQLPTRMVANLLQNSDSAPNHIIQLEITDLGTVYWNGNVSQVWDAGSSANVGGVQNWLSNTVSTNFISGDSVIFDETASAYLVAINGADVSPASVRVDPIGVDYVFSGTHGITGTTVLTKTSSGKATFTNPNSYTGITTISAGAIEIGDGGATGSLGSGAIINNATLKFNRNNTNTIANAISGNGAIVHDGTGITTLTGALTYTGTTAVNAGTLTFPAEINSSSYNVASGAVLDFNVAAATTRNMVSSSITGAGTLKKSGTGTIVWSGSVGTFSMASESIIDVQAGIFIAGSSANEVWTTNKSDLNVVAGAVFDAVEATSIENGGIFVDALSGAGQIKVGYPGGFASKITFGVDNGSGTFTGVLANSAAAGSFVKVGTGTQTLTGMNTYTGDTSIEAGTLSISQAYLANAADVRITTGATLDLAHSSVDSIDQLFVDNVAQPNGVYGSLASAAPTKVAYITGTGMLRVGLFGYPAWAAANASNQGANVDSDLDGIPNAVEYFMGQLNNEITLNPGVVANKVTWPRDPNAYVSFKVQISTDLDTWVDAPNAAVDTANPNSVIYTLPTGEIKHFVRLIVTAL